MSNYEDDIEPIAEASSSQNNAILNQPQQESHLGKRGRKQTQDEDEDEQLQAKRNARLSPEPDEDLDTSLGQHQVWLVKVPKFLMQGWSSVKADDKRLGTVRVYDPDHNGHQRMELLLPQNPLPPVPRDPSAGSGPKPWDNIPRAYDLRLTADSMATKARNLYAFKEMVEGGREMDDDDDEDDDDLASHTKAKAKKKGKGRRITALAGTVTNEASLQPQIRVANVGDKKVGMSLSGGAGISEEYRELLRKRREEASRPKRTIKMLDDSDAGRTNMLVAGVGGLGGAKSRFSTVMAQQKARPSGSGTSGGGGTEKFARMPKNELLDLLFSLFEKWSYWSLKKLRGETQQPESYLRETLLGIADLHKRGPYVGNWSLKPEYRNMRKEEEEKERIEAEAKEKERKDKLAVPSGSVRKEKRGGGDDDDDEDDDDDDDDDDEDDEGEDFDEVL
ncbi:hypothetical protein IE53DRAFT_380373 [Violaceomyces palustris]|uniref:Uncharacterized protein n=1 Tax=Violaceomyces palustris TaxID=1673888 RepID=A0ACD0NV37_9BASI|nr:hypothetical protein IE53DRAFT_380373 [Violaceomyces palustris]